MAPRSMNCSNQYRVTFSAAVPTGPAKMLLQHLETNNLEAAYYPEQSRDRRLRLPARHDAKVSGLYGVEVCHAWGMTEMQPARHIKVRSSRNTRN